MFSFLKKLLLPFSYIYMIIIDMRNFLYDKQFLKSEKFDVPTFAIGNLSVGGTGKTPHIEYFIRLFKKKKEIAVLSRGYGRKTKGFLLVEIDSNAQKVGDEPLQIKKHFPQIMVAVCEKRVVGIKKMRLKNDDLQLILLDDAFQHRAANANCYILLTTYQQPFTNDFVLPYGHLREHKKGYKRADIIIVTKCPLSISANKQQQLMAEISPFPHQKVFFSFLKYGNAFLLNNRQQKLVWQKEWSVLLICAIAKPKVLENYLREKTQNVKVLNFADHHFFTNRDIILIEKQFLKLKSKHKIIVTTEKDAVRLQAYQSIFLEKNLPIYVLPIQVFLKKRDENELLSFLQVFF